MDKKITKRLHYQNQRLQEKLAASQDEANAIKSSKAYRAIRMAGKLRDELKKSPTGLVKKTVRKVSSKGIKQVTLDYHNTANYGEKIQSQYMTWIELNEPDVLALDEQKQLSDQFKKRPLVSIITPVFNPPIDVFRELIESVLRQTYPYFELCLGNFGDNEQVRTMIHEYAQKDSRIKHWDFTENKGIAANSNEILRKSKGDYIALLDHDDTLAPHALYENIRLLNEDDYDFIHSDKDKIDEAGKRFDPFFKPRWSPETMLNANYLTHLNVMKTSLVRKIGGWRTETDGAQDWDLFLRVIAASKKPIGHIPKVLYHWRVIATSTAMSIETKPYALVGQRRTVDNYLLQENIKGKSYSQGAELLIDWPNHKEPIRIIFSTSFAHLASYLQNPDSAKTYVIGDYDLPPDFVMPPNTSYETTRSNPLRVLKHIVKQEPKRDFLIANDYVGSVDQYVKKQLQGWLSIDGVGGAAPMVMYGSEIMDCGAIFQEYSIRKMFGGGLPYLQTPLGNIEWVRNLNLVSSSCLMTSANKLLDAIPFIEPENLMGDNVIVEIQFALRKTSRLVFDPKQKVQLIDNQEPEYFSSRDIPFGDEYSSINIDCTDMIYIRAMRMSQDDEGGIENDNISAYQLEAIAHTNNVDIDSHDLEKNTAVIALQHTKALDSVKTALVIVPGFSAIYAGLNNIFSYMLFLQQQDIRVTIAILSGEENIPEYKQIVMDKFPDLTDASFVATNLHLTDELPATDIAICTQWATAYVLARYNNTKRKCYFIQDKEGSFYPRGSISALAEYSYKLGYFALANTPGLLEWYKQMYGGTGVITKSKVYIDAYSVDDNKKSIKPYKVFFYGRPNEPRNAFELGLASLRLVKERYRDDVEIYSAGAPWAEEDYDVVGVVKNLGKVPYDQLPSFYRSMDVGLMFMFSGHPGVVASELMASGCPVVVNEYDDETWNELYKHDQNALVAKPLARDVADQMIRALEDKDLRQKLIKNGRDKVDEFYAGFDESLQASLDVLRSPLV